MIYKDESAWPQKSSKLKKSRLVNQQRVKIIDFYTKKKKQLEQQKRLEDKQASILKKEKIYLTGSL